MHLKVNSSVMFKDSEVSTLYFHPKVTSFKNNQSNGLLMTMQTIRGSDYYGPVEFSFSGDSINWSKPEFIPAFSSIPSHIDGIKEGVCDVVPDYHEVSGKLLAIGHNVFYKNNGFLNTHSASEYKRNISELKRYSVYSIYDQSCKWSERKRIRFQEFEECCSFVCGCAQKVFLPDGRIIIPSTIGYQNRQDRMAVSLMCDFDGNEIKVLKRGNILENPIGRGLLEPSVIEFQNKYYLTLRAEDERGYLSVSDDGLNWSAIKPWQWEDGTPLVMSTTQQHWLKLGGKLFLVYTRQNEHNKEIIRWRAPLLIAEFDTVNLCLKKCSEQIVLPIRSNSAHPNTVALMGNFHTLAISEKEGIVTVGENCPGTGYSGDTLISRISI